MTLISVAYKALDEDTRQQYKDEASKEMAEYKAQYGKDANAKYKRQVKKNKEKKKKDREKKKMKSSAAIGGDEVDGGVEKKRKSAIDVAAKGDELPKERRKEKNKKSKKKWNWRGSG